MKQRNLLNSILCYAVLIIFLVCALFPVYWMLNTSFKTDIEIYLPQPTFYPQSPTPKAYFTLFTETSFLRSVSNSLIVSLFVAAVSIFFSMLASYSIARLKVRGGRVLSKCVLYTYLLPKSLLFIPLYMFVSKIGFSGRTGSLMLIYPTFTIPYAMWMLISYFKTVPREIEESAMVDGCGNFRIMFDIFFPLVTPGIVSTFIFCFTLCWNEYMYALVMITDTASRTFPLMLSELMVDDLFAWGPLMAGSILSCLPILLIYACFSSFVTSGLTLGAVKQ